MVVLFWLSFTATLAALLAAVAAGRRGRRRAHFALVAVFVVLLFVTIALTEALVRALDLPAGELAIHLRFAISATLLLLPVLASGVVYALRGGKRWRLVHRIAIVLFLLAVLTATGTGIWVVSLAG